MREEPRDCFVKFGKNTWHLHSVTLCAHSRYFNAALNGNFKVSRISLLGPDLFLCGLILSDEVGPNAGGND